MNQFLLLAQKENIIQFDLLNPKPVTLPINGLRNVIAIDYDMKNNCVYFADIVTDVIGVSIWFSTSQYRNNVLDLVFRILFVHCMKSPFKLPGMMVFVDCECCPLIIFF